MATERSDVRATDHQPILGTRVRDPSSRSLIAALEALAPTAGGRGTATAEERARLLEDVAEGLAPRDRALLVLSVGGHLDGAALATRVAVPVGQIYTVMNRMRRRAWRSVVAIVLVEAVPGRCVPLDELREATLGPSTLLRKRISRHVDRCECCAAEVRVLLGGLLGVSIVT